MTTDNTNEDLYTIPEDTGDPEKIDPMAKSLELLAQGQMQQSKAIMELANKVSTPTPVNVYTQPQAQVTDDPIQTLQAQINNDTAQLQQMLTNGDIDQSEYFVKYQQVIAPKTEQIKDLKIQKTIESTKNELQKGYDAKLKEQQDILDRIQQSNETKTEQEKIATIQNRFGSDAFNENSVLFKEMNAIFQDPILNKSFSNAMQNKDQYYALAEMASKNLQLKGITSDTKTNQAVNNMSMIGNPGVYQGETGTKTAFTPQQVASLKEHYGNDLTNDRLLRFSDYQKQLQETNHISLNDWLTRR